MTYLQRLIAQPQTVWLRKAIFQVHLWSGIGLGIYLLVVSVTGSIVVYSNELYFAATRPPVTVVQTGSRLTDDDLKAAAVQAHPGTSVINIGGGQKPDQAVNITLTSKRGREDRLFDPYTGKDLGNAVPFGIWAVSKLLELHDDLMTGPTGRSVNGFGAIMLVLLSLTGIVVWWPGIKSWRRSLTLHRDVGWRRFTWDLHSVMGFWLFGFIVLFGLSGAYLGNPQPFQDLADRLQPPTAANAGVRIVDRIIYWLAYLHFGRINGIGIPCHGPGLCDQTTKLVWALAGLVPAAMFVTGAIMWWNRVVRKKLGRSEQRS